MSSNLQLGAGQGAASGVGSLSSQKELLCKSYRNLEQQNGQWCSMCRATVIMKEVCAQLCFGGGQGAAFVKSALSHQ
jgi:hypothetical protein